MPDPAVPMRLHVVSAETDVSRFASGEPIFRTLEAARDALRSGLGGGSVREVHVHGTHYLRRAFELDGRDSGSAEHPIKYVGRDGARLSGGRLIPASAFKPATVPSGVAGVLVCNLLALGLNTSTFGSLASPYPKAKLELFYDGQPMTLARDPNIGTDALRTWHWAGYEHFSADDDLSFTLNDSATGRRWQAALNGSSSLWLHGFFKYDWRDTYVRIDSISKLSGGAFKFTRASSTPPQ